MVVNVIAAASSWERLVIWLPALVVGTGLLGAVLILLGRAFAATIRESGHPRWIYGGLAALVAAVVLLTYLGVSLPRE
jgi:TM2 domain-containing membrane protein YozV